MTSLPPHKGPCCECAAAGPLVHMHGVCAHLQGKCVHPHRICGPLGPARALRVAQQAGHCQPGHQHYSTTAGVQRYTAVCFWRAQRLRRNTSRPAWRPGRRACAHICKCMSHTARRRDQVDGHAELTCTWVASPQTNLQWMKPKQVLSACRSTWRP